MAAYSKAIFRIGVFFCLTTAAMVLSQPSTASAFQDCCQTCENEYEACLNGCTGLGCTAGCERQLRFCIEICPACE